MQPSLLRAFIWVPTSPKNSVRETLRIKFDPQSGHSVPQSRGHKVASTSCNWIAANTKSVVKGKCGKPSWNSPSRYPAGAFPIKGELMWTRCNVCCLFTFELPCLIPPFFWNQRVSPIYSKVVTNLFCAIPNADAVKQDPEGDRFRKMTIQVTVALQSNKEHGWLMPTKHRPCHWTQVICKWA